MTANIPRVEIKARHTAEANGDGALTVDTLRALLRDLPAEARVVTEQHDSQREGQSWKFAAVWTGSAKPGPAMRGDA